MTKGKPWSVEEEKLVKELAAQGVPVSTIAERMQKSEENVRQKLRRLGIKLKVVVVSSYRDATTTSRLDLPKELPTIEEAMKTLAAALKSLERQDLKTSEILRLKSIIQGVKIYKEIFADYVDYLGIEAEQAELRRLYEARISIQEKTTSKKSTSGPDSS